MTTYVEGERVLLLAFEETNQPEQEATVVYVEEGNGMYVVAVEPEDLLDDGIREVHEDQMRKLRKENRT